VQLSPQRSRKVGTGWPVRVTMLPTSAFASSISVAIDSTMNAGAAAVVAQGR
jgi:hypothetical protein